MRDGGKGVVLRPRRAMIHNLVEMAGLFALWFAFRGIEGLKFESEACLLAAIVLLAIMTVIAIRPPAMVLLPDTIVIRRFQGSTEVDRSYCIGYMLRRAEGVIGGASSSSNRSCTSPTGSATARLPRFRRSGAIGPVVCSRHMSRYPPKTSSMPGNRMQPPRPPHNARRRAS
jgi:hypothetical protein